MLEAVFIVEYTRTVLNISDKEPLKPGLYQVTFEGSLTSKSTRLNLEAGLKKKFGSNVHLIDWAASGKDVLVSFEVRKLQMSKSSIAVVKDGEDLSLAPILIVITIAVLLTTLGLYMIVVRYKEIVELTPKAQEAVTKAEDAKSKATLSYGISGVLIAGAVIAVLVVFRSRKPKG